MKKRSGRQAPESTSTRGPNRRIRYTIKSTIAKFCEMIFLIISFFFQFFHQLQRLGFVFFFRFFRFSYIYTKKHFLDEFDLISNKKNEVCSSFSLDFLCSDQRDLNLNQGKKYERKLMRR